jgi:prepilin-type N-terminal cleavage/methylation domain-containing protein
MGRGFTLVELLVAAGMLSVLMLALAGVIGVASRSLPSSDDPGVRAALLRRVVDMVASDAATATSVTKSGNATWAFVLAGWGPHGEDVTVVYAWSGEPGAPVTRAIDGADPQVLIADADDFLIDLVTEVRERSVMGSVVESGERLIAQCTEYPVTEQRLALLQALSHFVAPRLGAGVQSWRPTRLRILARSDGKAGGTTSVRIVSANSQGLPGSSQIASATMNESDLSSGMSWFTIPFASAGNVLPDDGVCIVLAHVSDTHSCAVGIVEGSVMDSRGSLAVSDTGGLAWTAVPDASLMYELYGTVREQQRQTQQFTVATGGGVRVSSAGASARAAFRAVTGMEVR